MGKVLDTYNRYRELLFSGDFAHLTEVADEDFVETCVGLTGWTRGLDIAAANFAAGIGAAFTDLTAQEFEHIENGDLLAIRGRGEGTHTARFLGWSRPGDVSGGSSPTCTASARMAASTGTSSSRTGTSCGSSCSARRPTCPPPRSAAPSWRADAGVLPRLRRGLPAPRGQQLEPATGPLPALRAGRAKPFGGFTGTGDLARAHMKRLVPAALLSP